jgi:hypothetical protein
MNIHYNFENEIRILRYINISHFIVAATSIYLYHVGLKEFYYTLKALYIIQKYSIIFIAISATIPIILIIFVPLHKKNVKILQYLKVTTLIFIIISFIVGLLINISIWKTSTEADTLFKICPYHFDDTLLNNILDKYLKEKASNKNIKFCNIRHCLLNYEKDEDSLAFNYVCNYDSSVDFSEKNKGIIYKRINSDNIEISSNKYIHCMKIKHFATNNNLLISYMDLCEENTLYKCDIFEKPLQKDFNLINNIESCPSINYERTAYLLATSFLLIDIICFVFLFSVEFLILKKMIYINEIPPNEEQNKDIQATINSTINRNNDQNNNEENENVNNNYNDNDIDNTFKKEMTQTIIVGNPRKSINQNDDLFISPLKSKEDTEGFSQNEDKKIRIQSLKNPSDRKLLNLNINKSYNDEDVKSENNNESDNENKHRVNAINDNKRNHKSKFANKDQCFQSVDTTTVPIKTQIINVQGEENQFNDNQVSTIYPFKNQEIKESKEKIGEEEDRIDTD